jgi:hypothetical protein
VRVLIIRNTELWVHQVLMCLAQYIKNTYADASIDWLTSEGLKDYVQRFDCINEVFVLQGDGYQLASKLLAQKYTHVLDFERSSRSYFFAHYLPKQYNARTLSINYPRGILMPWRSKLKYWQLPNITSQVFKAAKKLSIQPGSLQWQYPLLPNDALADDDIPTSHSAGYYCLELNATSDVQKTIQIIQSIKLPVILTGNATCINLANEIKQADEFKIYVACGKFSEPELLHIYKRAKLAILSSYHHLGLVKAASCPCIWASTLPYIANDIVGKSIVIDKMPSSIAEIVAKCSEFI